jgi:hypothetical protein
MAVSAVDDLILRTANSAARMQRWSEATGALARLSDHASERPESLAAATAVLLPVARQKLDRHDWNGAADAIVAARRLGVAPSENHAARRRDSHCRDARRERRKRGERRFAASPASPRGRAAPDDGRALGEPIGHAAAHRAAHCDGA